MTGDNFPKEGAIGFLLDPQFEWLGGFEKLSFALAPVATYLPCLPRYPKYLSSIPSHTVSSRITWYFERGGTFAAHRDNLRSVRAPQLKLLTRHFGPRTNSWRHLGARCRPLVTNGDRKIRQRSLSDVPFPAPPCVLVVRRYPESLFQRRLWVSQFTRAPLMGVARSEISTAVAPPSSFIVVCRRTASGSGDWRK